MKFGEFRKYVSKIDRVSICMRESLSYENYQFIEMVPERYNEYYLYGVGGIQSEFPLSEVPELVRKLGQDKSQEELEQEIVYAECLEIMLSETPRVD